MFSESDKKTILGYSRKILEVSLQRDPEPELCLSADLLEAKRGIFVTLKKEKRLRGCIGQILGYEPLRQSIREMTLAAAFDDPRFPPVNLNELRLIKIHISILTVPKPVASYKDIRIGLDGIIVSCGRKKGVYLPEVAVETGWDQRTFFTSCALEKAQMTAAELDKATLEVFQTESFEEEGYSS